MPITDVKIRNAKPSTKPFKIADSEGLYIEIRPSGKKLWRYRYKIAGKENVYALGGYPDLSLSDARAARNDARKLVKQGIHPAMDRAAKVSSQVEDNQNTFKAVALEWYTYTGGKKSWTPYYAKQIETCFNKDVFPSIGNLPIRSITPKQVLSLLDRIEKRGAGTVALLVKQWCSAVFCYAVGRRKADNDPTAVLRGAIQRRTVVHSKPLPVTQIPAFLRALDEYNGQPTTVIAMKLIMLTFVRTKELRQATWDEFDFERSEWRIPAERMKMRQPHVVPLSRQAVYQLQELHALTGSQKWLFPNIRNSLECMSATTLNRAIGNLGWKGKFAAHGFRSTASSLLHEMGFNTMHIERQLAHKDKNSIRGIYNQAEYLAERRTMLQQWADFLDGLKGGAKIIPIRQAA